MKRNSPRRVANAPGFIVNCPQAVGWKFANYSWVRFRPLPVSMPPASISRPPICVYGLLVYRSGEAAGHSCHDLCCTISWWDAATTHSKRVSHLFRGTTRLSWLNNSTHSIAYPELTSGRWSAVRRGLSISNASNYLTIPPSAIWNLELVTYERRRDATGRKSKGFAES